MIVVDTNVMMYLLAGDGPFAERAADLLRRDAEWAGPPILLSEVRNVLVGSVRRGLLEVGDAEAMEGDAATIVAGRVAGVDGAGVMRIALDLGLSAYDAEFVALARALGVELVTGDRQILEAAPDVARTL